MPDYPRIAEALTSPGAFLALADDRRVFGAKKQAAAAFALWSRAEERYVGASRSFATAAGTSTGLAIRVFWNPETTTPRLAAIASGIATALPDALARADEKATRDARDRKQSVFFAWRGMSARPLSQWFQERFGVGACTTRLTSLSDLTQDVAVVASSGGVDHLWTLTAPR
ncbi:hypothetical protein LLS1_04640 [Leifsonia sp. LS1]|uniref:hypothetical protein n=1 Tax=unclassified Leifsonia TaxID=2663824 RepID=UPI001CC02ED2|nr:MULTISPECIES: hypothetical protein [unclassified Leifsonia]UAJ79212.1 hypothetical protein IT072_18730 [Leifsonia sp. ZF2019]GIT78795.1 hypothetical protein LLS1_04640 [Leifsonia sp. LS1]